MIRAGRGSDKGSSPAIKTSPCGELAGGREGMVLGELRTGSTGVIGKNAQSRPDREECYHIIGRHACIGFGLDRGENPVFLVGAAKHVVFEGCAVETAWLPISEIASTLGGSAITAHRHPSGVDDHPTSFRLVPDNRGDHAQCDIGDRAHADVVHYEIEEYVYPGADLGDAIETFRRKRGRRRTDADHLARNAGSAQTLRGPHATGPLLLRERHETFMGIEFVAGTRMRHHSTDL